MSAVSFGPGMRVTANDGGRATKGVVQSLHRLADGTTMATVALDTGKTITVAAATLARA
ncbi:hypothetical protein EXIGLDRAFT_768108 [Exidia glandulosa HHB12029]|uniref:Hypervirulence associated protein TUDOR domain-containing protein n=1 Tax=Exidia glandulosa HHB12029 TaxID=1314781 RepID=A0A165IFI0_EXIGL|nr:hypothetical protein EXIGLDRAFT_768108 [Exidia glandulosa HHB12029]